MNTPNTDPPPVDERSIELQTLPESVPPGAAILLAKPAPFDEFELPLRVVAQYTDSDECLIAATTSLTADEIIRQYTDNRSTGFGRFGVIDATAKHYQSAPYQEHPTISIQYPGELVQLTLAFWELHTAFSKSCLRTHFVIQSLTPLLLEDDLDRVVNVLQNRIERQRENSSLTVCSIQYTQHDDATMNALMQIFDGVLWVEESADGQLGFDYERARGRDLWS